MADCQLKSELMPPFVRRHKKQNVFFKQEPRNASYVSPVLTLDPGGEELPQLHGEAVAVQVVELLQIPGIQLLQLVPLGHPDTRLQKPTHTHTYGVNDTNETKCLRSLLLKRRTSDRDVAKRLVSSEHVTRPPIRNRHFLFS